MSLPKEIYDILKDVREARSNFKKTHAKDDYIKLMENQLDSLIQIIDELDNELEVYKNSKEFTLNNDHLKVLKIVKDSPNMEIESDTLTSICSTIPTLELALAELRENDYIIYTRLFYEKPNYYSFKYENKAKILKALINFKG